MTSARLLRDRWELDTRPLDVLVFGSQLVYGSVGTNASLPPMEDAGLRIAAVPTALLSNLPHQASVHTLPIPSDWIAATLNDLTALDVTSEVATVCTGYFANPQQIEVAGRWLAALVERRPELQIIVDPTLGDTDVGFYTDPLVADALIDHLLPLATGLTPNAFELTVLQRPTSIDSPTSLSIPAQARNLLQGRTDWVIVTGGTASPDPALVSTTVVTADDDVTLTQERLPTEAKGAGDVFAGALVAALHRGSSLTEATSTAMTQVRHALAARSLS